MKENTLNMTLEEFKTFVTELKKISQAHYPEFNFQFNPDFLISLYPRHPQLAYMSALNFHMVLQDLN